MEQKTVILPSSDIIMSRLTSVLDEPTIRQRFYPRIAEKGGTERNAYGIVNLFMFALNDYVQEEGYHDSVLNSLYLWLPDFIEALVDDKEVVSTAKNILVESRERTKAKLSKFRSERNASFVSIPGVSIFGHTGETFNNAYLVNANFVLGSHGVIDIWHCDQIEIRGANEERQNFKAIDGKLYSGLQEPETWSDIQRNIQPLNRGSQETYNGFALQDHDIIQTSNGSRFLSLKRTHRVGKTSTSAGDYPEREAAVILKSKARLQECLHAVLPRMGIPDRDVEYIVQDILLKIG